MSYYLLKNYNYREALLWIFLTVPVLSTFHYTNFQWTNNAYLFCGIGFFLTYNANRVGKAGIVFCLMGIVLTSFGFMTRVDCFWSAILLFAFFLILDMFKSWRKKELKIFIKNNKYLFICSIILFCLCSCLQLTNDIMYAKADDGRWKYHQKYNFYRSSLWDYGGIQYMSNEKAFDDIGMDSISSDLFNSGCWSDANKFDLETLEKVKTINDSIYMKSIVSTIKLGCMRAIVTIVKSQAILYLILLVCFWAGIKRGEIVFDKAMGVIIIICEGVYLVSRGRIEERNVYGLLLLLLLFLITITNSKLESDRNISQSKQRANRHRTVCYFVLLSVSLCCYIYIEYNSNVRKYAADDYTISFLDSASADKDNLYLLDIHMHVYINASFEATYIMPENYYSNLYFLGDWDVYTPRSEAVLKNYGIENPFEAIASGRNCYLVDNRYSVEIKKQYLEYHYNYYDDIKYMEKINQDYCLYQFNPGGDRL